MDVFFDFDSKQPKGDHSADFTAIKDFIAAKSEYLVTLRGYTCSIGRKNTICVWPRSGWKRSRIS